MSEIDEIRHMICEIGNLLEIAADDNLQEAGFTSMGVLQLLTELEEKYSVSIPDEQFMAAETPRDLNKLISSLRQGDL